GPARPVPADAPIFARGVPAGSVPRGDRFAGRAVERTRDEAARRDADREMRTVGHRQVGRAAVERIHPRQPGAEAARKRPDVHARRPGELVDRPRLGTLARDIAIATADAIEAERGVEP